MKRILTAVSIGMALAGIVFPVAARASEQGQLDSDITLFTVMAAINVAGYDAGLDSASGSPVRAALRQDLKRFGGKTLTELQTFYRQHQLSDPGQDLAQYISFALQNAGPPDFKFRVSANDISPDALAIAGLGRLLADFHREAGIETLYAKYLPAYEKEIERYHEPVTQAVLGANAYLRLPTAGYLDRRFQIYIDLLTAPDLPTVRGYGLDTFVVVHPSPELNTTEIRHAYLHYLLDPFTLKYASAVREKDGLGKLAASAPALDEAYKLDFSLLVTESLIKAVEARTKYGSADQKEALAGEGLRQGFILTPFFYEQLLKFEGQQQGMRLYYPEMIAAIDMRKETRRLRDVKFEERLPERRPPRAEPVPPPLTGLAKTLQDAEDSIRRHELAKAKSLLAEAREQTGGRDARPLYGLGRVAALEKDPELAKQLFEMALTASPDPHVLAMCHLYLGRMEDLFGSREQAVEHYRAAMAAGDPTPGTREAAEKGLKESFASPRSK